MTTDSRIAEIKKHFMALRNGIVGDVYRRAGITCYNVIFGLNLPQIASIARNYQADESLADALWADRGVRESRILSVYLRPVPVSAAKLEELLADAQTREESDILRWKLGASASAGQGQ